MDKFILSCHFTNLPIILTLCHVANLIENMAMFYFVKGPHNHRVMRR